MIPQNNYKSQKVSADLNRIIHYRDIQWAEWIAENLLCHAESTTGATVTFSRTILLATDVEVLMKLAQPKEEY